MATDLARVLRREIRRYCKRKSLYRLAEDSGVKYPPLHRFINDRDVDLTLGTASKLCKVLNLQLVREDDRDGG